MRLLVIALAVLVGGSSGQQSYYPRAPLRPIAPYRYSSGERVVSQGRITTASYSPGISYDYDTSPKNPCSPTPCGPNTRCEESSTGVARCRCLTGYIPDGDTIHGCKHQCQRNDDCPDDYRCQANKCKRVCVTGACGLNAECDARNHAAICTCPRNYHGDPHIKCRQEEKEERVLPPAPYVSPCQGRPCGTNADCRVDDDEERAVCSCPYGYEGNPLISCIRGECTENNDCPSYQVCRQLRCIDPCSTNICGINSDCETKNHRPVCSCRSGYVGDAMTRCRKFDPQELCHPSPCGENTNCRVENDRAVCSCISNYLGDPLTRCRPECVSDSECPYNMACRNNICYNPCRDACGENAYCDIKNRRAECRCPKYYQGNPRSRCFAECTAHDDCPSNRACLELKCGDPCVNACGTDAICKVKNHRPICSCPKTHTGDPFQFCRPFTPADYCKSNPCGSGAECHPGTDKEGNDRAVCICPKYYVGNPLISCQKGECESQNQCPDHLACYQYVCQSPCYTYLGDYVCGEDAQCNVENHVPVCSCPKGYKGDPLNRCYIEDRRSLGGYVLGRSK